jgi:hypothetical protein
VMNARSYTDQLRKIFELLDIITSHHGHFGRVVGPVKLDFEEVAVELIRILGKSQIDGAAVCVLSIVIMFLMLLSFSIFFVVVVVTGNWDPKTQEK